MRRPSTRFTIRRMTATTWILILAELATAGGANQPPALSARSQEVIELKDISQHGRVYDLAFSPRREPLVCAFAVEQAVEVWDVLAKPRRIATLTPPRPTNVAPGYWGDTHGLAFSSDGGRLAMGYFFSFQIWDFDRRKMLYEI